MQTTDKKANILIVDDRVENLIALEALLCNQNLNLIRAQSGRDALKQALENEFALILLDVEMPRIDGFETAELIRRREKSRHTPIIFLTAVNKTREHIFKGYASGAVDYLTKPLVPEILRSKVMAFVELYELKKEREHLIRAEAARCEAEIAERRAAFLAEASRKLASTLDYEKTVGAISQLPIPFLADWCFVRSDLEDASGRSFAVAHADPLKSGALAQLTLFEDFSRAPFPIPQVLQTAAPALVQDISGEALESSAPDAAQRAVLLDAGCGSALIVPLFTCQTVTGFFGLVSAKRDRYGRAEVSLVQDLARRISLTLDNVRLMQKAQAANHAKDEFLATLSHEIRTPLNAILGWIQILRNRRVDQVTAARAMEAIERNATAQLSLIEDMLDLSAIVTGRLQLQFQLVSFEDAVEAALDAIRPAAEAKGVRLETDLKRSRARIYGDVRRLQQIVWNLLSNAVKFTPPSGSVQVRLEQPGSQLRLTVSDTGKGIDPQFLPFIFDRFRQGENATTRKYGGLGLGLSIARHLAELHGGVIEAFSEGEGKGAAFVVSLPVREARPVTFTANAG